MIKILWTSKWKPNSFKDIIGVGNSIKDMVDELPNFLFYGSPGCGKTATAKVIIKTLQADSLILNSSLDRKIETVRTKVKDFVSTKSSNNKIKIILMDEADGLLNPVQESLRGVIEDYSKWVRWIFTCNNINKISDAIQSRCTKIKFTSPKKEKISERLVNILEKERCSYEIKAVHLLVEKLYPDMRNMINNLQTLTVNGKEAFTEEKLEQVTTLLEKVLENIKAKNFDEARLAVLNDGVEPDEFFNELYLHLMKSNLPVEQKEKINEVAMQCNFFSAGALNKHIPLEAFIFKLIGVGVE